MDKILHKHFYRGKKREKRNELLHRLKLTYAEDKNENVENYK